MKRLLIALMTLLCVASAFALQVTDAVIVDDPGFASAKFKITNDEDYPLKDISITTNANSKYNISFQKPSTIQVDQAVDVTVTGDIPDDFSLVLTEIGTITVTAELNVPDDSSPFGGFSEGFSELADALRASRLIESNSGGDDDDSDDDDADDVNSSDGALDVLIDDGSSLTLNTCNNLWAQWDALQAERAEKQGDIGALGGGLSEFWHWLFDEYMPRAEALWQRLEDNNCLDDYDADDDDNSDSEDDDDDNNNAGENNHEAQNTTVTASSKLKMAREKRLIIDGAKIDCGRLKRIDNGGRISDINPGSLCEVTIDVKNTHTKSSDPYFRDVEVEFLGDNEFSDDSDDVDIDAGDEEAVTLEVEVDIDADTGDEDLTIRVSGTDSEGVYYEDEWNFVAEIERPKHNLKIEKLSLSKSEVDLCLHSSVDLTVKVSNMGTTDEDDVKLAVEVPLLDFKEIVTDIMLDADEDDTVHVRIPIPDSTNAGSYTVDVEALYDGAVPSDSATTSFVVRACEVDEEPEPVVQPQQKVVYVQPPANTEPVIEAEPIEDDNSAVYSGLLILANLAVLCLLAVLGVTIAKNLKPKRPF